MAEGRPVNPCDGADERYPEGKEGCPEGVINAEAEVGKRDGSPDGAALRDKSIDGVTVGSLVGVSDGISDDAQLGALERAPEG